MPETNYPEDLEFTNGDLELDGGEHVKIVYGVLPGGITVVDNDGYVVMPDQREHVSFSDEVDGVVVVLEPFLVNGELPGTWKIRYNRGIKGDDALDGGLSAASSEELMLYSLLFG